MKSRSKSKLKSNHRPSTIIIPSESKSKSKSKRNDRPSKSNYITQIKTKIKRIRNQQKINKWKSNSKWHSDQAKREATNQQDWNDPSNDTSSKSNNKF